jgi:dTDP-4-dehydrorhamnose reductase
LIKILLLGEYGQLGWELKRALQGLGQVLSYDYPEIDLAEPRSVKRTVNDLQPQIIINAAAYTNVDKAEVETRAAELINTEAPALLAELCRKLGAGFIHYSTDYVFDGEERSPYRESDAPLPLNAYGRTKLNGDKAIMEVGGAFLILRTAWVYSRRKDSYVSKVLSWARRQVEMRVVDDQVSSPTWARALAEITAHLLAKAGPDPRPWLSEHRGLYHIAGRGVASRLEWAEAIVRNDPNREEQIVRTILPAKSAEFPSLAVRPHFSALDCDKFERTFMLRLPDWQDALNLALGGE